MCALAIDNGSKAEIDTKLGKKSSIGFDLIHEIFDLDQILEWNRVLLENISPEKIEPTYFDFQTPLVIEFW